MTPAPTPSTRYRREDGRRHCAVAIVTNNDRPAPLATPKAAASQMDAAVVRPFTTPLDVVMTPAPKNPEPVAAAAAMRAASPFGTNKPATVKHAEPMETRAIVRTPTGLSRLVARPLPIRSKPRALPLAAATTNRPNMTSWSCVETTGSAWTTELVLGRATAPRRRGPA